MTSEQNPYQLTTDDVRALREADSMTFHAYDGEGFIRAHRRVEKGTPISVRDQRVFGQVVDYGQDRFREVPVTWRLLAYGDDGYGTRPSREDAACFHMIHSSHYDHAWQTIAYLLRAGDHLGLEWTADNNNDVIRSAGLHCDEVALAVGRERGRALHFHLYRQVSPDNSARMVKRGSLLALPR